MTAPVTDRPPRDGAGRAKAEGYGRQWAGAVEKAHNLDAEAGVLGGVLIKNEVLSMLGSLETDHFYDWRHRVVFAAIRALEAARKPIDTVTLEVEIERAGKLESIGGMAFIGELALRVPTPDNVEHYARAVREHAITRATLLVCSRAGQAVMAESMAGEELLDEMIGELSVIDRPHAEAEMTIASVVAKEAAAIDAWMMGEADESTLPRIRWGIEALDAVVGGAPVGQLTCIGARPGVGKTTLLINFAMRTEEPGVVFTNEDDPEQDLATFFLAWQARIDSRALFERTITQIEWRQVAQAKAALARRTHVRLERAAGMSWPDIARRIMFLRHKHGIRWWALDYLQQIKGDPSVNRTAQIQAACEGAQRICAGTGAYRLAGIMTSQLLRPSERDQGGRQQAGATRPTMHMLKDSSAIEACAKQIILLHPNPEKPNGQVEALIPKFRRGAGKQIIDLACDYRYSWLGDLGGASVPPTKQQAWATSRDDVPHPADTER